MSLVDFKIKVLSLVGNPQYLFAPCVKTMSCSIVYFSVLGLHMRGPKLYTPGSKLFLSVKQLPSVW